MPVELRRSVGADPPFDDGMERAAELLLAELGQSDAELSVLLTDDSTIRSLNERWRDKDAATDVLSFAQTEALEGEAPQLGDIVISLETAAAQATAGNWTLVEETNRLLVHGLLHLLGHEHEAGGAEAGAMQTEERRLAGRLIAAGLPCAAGEIR